MSNPAHGTSAKGKKEQKITLSALAGRSEGGGSQWGELHPDFILNVIQTLTMNNGAIQFTRTRDGGALGIRIFHSRFTKDAIYGTDDGEMTEILERVLAEVTD